MLMKNLPLFGDFTRFQQKVRKFRLKTDTGMPSDSTATQTDKWMPEPRTHVDSGLTYRRRTKVSWRKKGEQSQTKETKLNTRHTKQETGKIKQEVTKHQTQRLDRTHEEDQQRAAYKQ